MNKKKPLTLEFYRKQGYIPPDTDPYDFYHNVPTEKMSGIVKVDCTGTGQCRFRFDDEQVHKFPSKIKIIFYD